MRKLLVLSVAALVLAGCSQPPHGMDSQKPAPTTASPSASETPSESPTTFTFAELLSASEAVDFTAEGTQVDCEKGTVVLTSNTRLLAQELNEIYVVATIGCKVGANIAPETVEIFHWRDEQWLSVGTIYAPKKIFNVTGECTSDAVSVSCPATRPEFANASSETTAVISRSGYGFSLALR